jgi:hypothetical protein
MRDPRAIFDQADAYFLASNILEEQVSQARPQLLMPFSVYGAFALELYLKCALALEGKAIKREHDLVQLFSDMDQTTQTMIRAEFDRLLLPLDASAVRDAKPWLWIVNFDSCLSAGRNIFMKWRYAYETPANSAGWTPNMTAATRNSILSLRPDWPSALRR